MKSKIMFFLIFLVLFFFVFRSLIFNLSTDLLDWRDYSLMLWIIFQHIDKITHLDFANYFATSAFYPHPYSLLFSDLLLPQALLALPLFLISNNLVLSFNIVFVLTFILNYFASFLLWKLLFKRNVLAFFGSVLLIFSPFLHMELSHFQMISYWPFLFALFFLFRNEEIPKKSNILLVGLFLSIQFLSSVYLAVFLITTIVLYFLIRRLSGTNLKPDAGNFVLIFAIFLLVCGFFIKGYLDMKETYNLRRDLEEYVNYSAQISDYIFSTNINSIIHKSSIAQKWNNFDKNNFGAKASFQGFLIFFLSIVSIFEINKKKGMFSISIEINQRRGFFLGLLLIGLLFSLGPRISFNGTYAHIPLPYTLAIKYVPMFDLVRAEVRWSYLFYFGLIYFALISLDKISRKKHVQIYLSVIFLVFILEYIPLNIKTFSKDYTSEYPSLKKLCLEKRQVLLEVPVTHLNAGTNIVEGLTYITTTELATVYHSCNLINGYSGYDLPDNLQLDQTLNQIIKDQNIPQLLSLLEERNVNILKINRRFIIKELQQGAQDLVEKLGKVQTLKEIEPGVFLKVSKN